MNAKTGFVVAALLVTPQRVQPPEEYLHSAALLVERAGWVRVTLDASMQSDGSARRDWRVYDPDGVELPRAILAPLSGTVSGRTLSVERDPDGWHMVFDLGPTPLRHRSVRVEPVENVTAPGARLEGSDDRNSWSALATADLFWLGRGQGLRGSVIEYPASDDRYLRLHWPSSAGFPELRNVSVEALSEPPGGRLELALQPEVIRESAGEREYSIAVPDVPVETLALELEGEGSVGFRLLHGGSRGWSMIEEGEHDLAGESGTLTIRLPDRGEHPATGSLRLVLYGDEQDAVRLASASISYLPLWLLFRAPEPAEYTLAYGAWKEPSSAAGAPDLSNVTDPVTPAAAGEPRFHPPPPVPSRLTAPGDSLGNTGAGASWRIVSERAAPGAWVSVELPDVVYDETDGNVSRLRVATQGREVPFLLRTRGGPVRMFERRGVTPDRTGPGDDGLFEMDLPSAARYLTQIEILSWESPLSLDVGGEFRRELRPGVESRPMYRTAERWTCDQWEILPCRKALDLSLRAAPRGMTLSLGTLESNPDLTFDLIGWRERHVVNFVWPETDDVRLVVGLDEGAASYPALADLRDRIDAIPPAAAEVATDEPERAGDTSRRNFFFLIVALVVAGAVLIGILVRTISSADQAEDA